MSSSFALQSEPNLINKLDKVLARSKAKFIKSQFDSTAEILESVALLEGPATDGQLRFIEEFKKQFINESNANQKWA